MSAMYDTLVNHLTKHLGVLPEELDPCVAFSAVGLDPLALPEITGVRQDRYAGPPVDRTAGRTLDGGDVPRPDTPPGALAGRSEESVGSGQSGR
ncbi:hypothetical protein [Streptomyces sp. SID161]|uniref:hypothetical protein n=1 Tax=Streptomyces sp. SID161 TaxID=2690251 RepID=UPI0013F98091|nr:hypothetical protein [Streptomyces sp. SID161]MYW41867.1 hypothetical protein [Streptomyces sp. SID161]